MFNAPTWTLADQKFDTSYIKTDPDCTHLVAFAWKTAAGEDRFSSMVASTGDLDQDLLGTSVRQQCMNHISRMAKDEGVLEGSVTFDVRPMRYTAPIPPGVTVTPTHFTLDLANEELRASMLAAYCNLQNYLAYAGYDDVDPASTAALEMSKVLRDLNK